jgi:hypothetical protein
VCVCVRACVRACVCVSVCVCVNNCYEPSVRVSLIQMPEVFLMVPPLALQQTRSLYLGAVLNRCVLPVSCCPCVSVACQAERHWQQWCHHPTVH